MLHAMLDLETLDTAPTAVFQQIGIAVFNPMVGPEESSLIGQQIFVDVQSCLDAGLTMSWGTIKWWMGQTMEARKQLCTPGIPLAEALGKLGDVFATNKIEGVWSHGATFDLPILQNAYAKLRTGSPWRHTISYDTRTLFMLRKPTWPKNELLHSAVNDAVSQAKAVQSVFSKVYGTTTIH